MPTIKLFSNDSLIADYSFARRALKETHEDTTANTTLKSWEVTIPRTSDGNIDCVGSLDSERIVQPQKTLLLSLHTGARGINRTDVYALPDLLWLDYSMTARPGLAIAAACGVHFSAVYFSISLAKHFDIEIIFECNGSGILRACFELPVS